MLYLCLPVPFHPDHSAIIMQTPWRTAKSVSCLDVLSLPPNFLQEIRTGLSYLGYKSLDLHWMATDMPFFWMPGVLQPKYAKRTGRQT